MVKILFYLFFLGSFIFLVRKKREFIFFFPLFNLIADMSFSFFEGFSAPTFLRAGIVTLFFFYAIEDFKKVKLSIPFLIFFLYLAFTLILSNEFVYSAKAIVQIVLSMSAFMLGYVLIDSLEKYHRLMRSYFWFILVATGAVAVGYLFGIGQDLEYTTEAIYVGGPENVGLLGSGGLYAPGIALGLLPLIVKQDFSRLQKWILYSSSFLLYVFILLNVRRTAIMIPIIGMLGFLLYSKTRRVIFKYILLGVLGITITFPLWSNQFIRRYNLREQHGRFEADFMQTESRYTENLDLMEEIKKFDNPLKIFFGVGNNVFAEAIENGTVVRRMYHSDSAKLIYGVGLFGVFLYLIIYFRIIWKIIKIPSSGMLKDLKAASLGIFIISLAVIFNGSITQFTFRSIMFLMLGAFLGFSMRIIKSNGTILIKPNNQINTLPEN